MREVLGFEKNKKLFQTAIFNSQLAHAYLFTGQEMIGKRTFALELAVKIINPAPFVDMSAAKPSEAWFKERCGASPDICFVNAEMSESGQTIAIAEARRIKNFVSMTPYAGERKVVVIDDAHLMTTEAQNALLKVLEEPSPSSVLILVTASPDGLLPTIVSRCQEVKFTPHPRKIIESLLIDSGLTKKQQEFLVEFANGRVGLVKNVLAEKSFGEIEESVRELAHLVKADINERIVVAQKLTDEKNKADLARKVLYWQLYMRMRLDEPKAPKILRGLLDLQAIISQPQFNHRLALENFLVSL